MVCRSSRSTVVHSPFKPSEESWASRMLNVSAGVEVITCTGVFAGGACDHCCKTLTYPQGLWSIFCDAALGDIDLIDQNRPPSLSGLI